MQQIDSNNLTFGNRTPTTMLDGIGDTPLVEVEGVWAKCEFLNPSGSVKARIAKYMVEKAEQEGLLKPGDTIVEASSGNTGNALSMVAAAKGYGMLVVMPRGMSSERLVISRAFGAEVLEVGVGTGGTLIGVGQAFREVNPDMKLFGVEPDESCTLLCGETDRHLIEGISDGFVSGIFERYGHTIDGVIPVESEEAVREMRRLARQHGLFVGPSSGAHLAARRVQEEHPEFEDIVTILCDEGEKYLSEHFYETDSEER